MKYAKNYTPEYLLLVSIFGALALSQHGEINNKTNIIINEYYTGTKTLKEKLLNLMIKEIRDGQNV